MAKEFSLTIEQSEDGNLTAVLPELEGSRIEAESLEELMSKLKEALELWFKPEED